MKLILIFLFIPVLQPLAFAEEVDDIRAFTIEGKKFVCFDEPSALKVLRLRLEFPKLQSKLLLLQEKIDIKNAEVETLNRTGLILQSKLGIVVNENVSLYQKLEKANAWYKSPWLWFGVGILVGGAIAVGAVALSG